MNNHSSVDSIPASYGRHLRNSALCVAPSALLVLALWIPYGFSLIGHIEEWGLLGAFTTHGVFFITDSSSPLAAHALRPLTILPQAIAYYLDPYSFKYWNLLLALAIIIKGSSVSYIVQTLTRSWGWGTVAAVLFIVYPADTMQISFRALHINWALSLVLLASALFLYALSTPNRDRSLTVVALSATLIFSACAMYEASLLLTGLPLIVIFVQSGVKQLIKHVREALWKHIIWFSGAVAYVAYVIHTAPLVKSYQSGIAGENAWATLTHSFPHLFSIGLLRTILGGWYDAARMTKVELLSYGYPIFIVILLFLISATPMLRREDNSSKRASIDIGLSIRSFVAGIALILLGYAPFLLSTSHQTISQRTFLFASLGGVFTCLAILFLINRYSKKAALTATVLLYFIGISSQLYQFHHYVNLSIREQSVLKSIVDNLDGEAGTKKLLILDKSNQINGTWMFLVQNLTAALTYIYGLAPNEVIVCHIPSNEWQQADSIGRKGTCEETVDSWVFHAPPPVEGPGIPLTTAIPDRVIAKKDIVSVTADPDNVSNEPKPFQGMNEHFTNVYEGVVAPKRFVTHLLKFNDQAPQNAYFWGFGNWWSMELPIAGSGWREAEWTVNSFVHDASAWKTADQATLIFSLKPNTVNYKLTAKFDVVVNEDIKNSLKISVNGLTIPTEWNSPTTVTGTIDANSLRQGINSLVLTSDTDTKYYGLSLKMTSIQIKPI